MKIGMLILFANLVVISYAASADYIIASRNMLLKDAPERDANTISNINKLDKLVVADGGQHNGYYSVELKDGTSGYVYRTVGRPVIEESQIAEDDQQHDVSGEIENNENSCGRHLIYGVPDKSDQILCREGYALGYSYDYKIPVWVSYSVTSNSADLKIGEREDAGGFTEDQNLPEEYRSRNSDYKSTGYDKGHMAPNAAMDFNLKSQKESFLLSNISPQLPGFNRNMFGHHGVWGYVEDLERKWVKERGELIVIAGTYVAPDAEYIGDGVAIPSHFYRILFDPVKLESLAFWFPHEINTANKIETYLTSIDEIESKTNINFFDFVNEDVQGLIELAHSQAIWSR